MPPIKSTYLHTSVSSVCPQWHDELRAYPAESRHGVHSTSDEPQVTELEGERERGTVRVIRIVANSEITEQKKYERTIHGVYFYSFMTESSLTSRIHPIQHSASVLCKVYGVAKIRDTLSGRSDYQPRRDMQVASRSTGIRIPPRLRCQSAVCAQTACQASERRRARPLTGITGCV